MLDFSVNVDPVYVSALDSALKNYAAALGKDASTAPRRGAILLCQSLRAGTRVAKKNRPFSAALGNQHPKYVTAKDGRKLRRWTVHLKDRGTRFDRFVYAEGKNDGRKQLKEQVGTNYYPLTMQGKSPAKRGGTRGLARQSWGWVMHNIYCGAAPDAPWHRRKHDRRSPKDAAKESVSRPFYALISNRLDYALDALKIPLETAMDKAASRMVHLATAKTPKEL